MNRTFRVIFTTFLLLVSSTLLLAQTGIGTTNPEVSAKLDVSSTTKGFLPPRMTAVQRSAILNPAAGLMVYQIDGTKGLYYYDGASWIFVINSASNVLPVANGGTGATTLNGVLTGNGASAITAVAPGASGNSLVSNGSSWTSTLLESTNLPSGIISAFAGNTAPTGYLLCDGREVSRTTYADLFAVIGTTYGAGNGTSTFNLPDLRGRTVFGIDNMGGTVANRLTTTGGISANNARGATGGSQTIALVAANLPSHTHIFTGTSATTSSDAHTHTYQDAYFAENISGGTGSNARFGLAANGDFDNSFYFRTSSNTHSTSPSSINTSSDSHSHTVTASGSISATGSNQAFSNLPPLLVVNYIIKF